MVLQFEWADYEADLASLATMAREEVVAMLKRNSTGFSRRAGVCSASTHFACETPVPRSMIACTKHSTKQTSSCMVIGAQERSQQTKVPDKV